MKYLSKKKGVFLLLFSLFFLSLSLKASGKSPPLPSPTPIIQNLGVSLDERGIYHSSLLPFTVKVPKGWIGSLVLGGGDPFDKFYPSSLSAETQERFFVVSGGINSQGISQSEAEQIVLGSFQGSGSSPSLGGYLLIEGKKYPLFYVTVQGVNYEEGVAVIGTHVWTLGGVSDETHLKADRKLLLGVAQSLHVPKN